MISFMSSKSKSVPASASRYTLGRHAFARISAVEGIRLTPAMDRTLREFDEKHLSGDERRRAIARKYGKAGKA